MGVGIISQALGGLGQGMEQVGIDQHRAAILAERDQNLAKLQEMRDQRLHQQGMERDTSQAQLARETHAVNADTDIANIPKKGAAENEVLRGRIPINAENTSATTKAKGEAELELAPRMTEAKAEETKVIGAAQDEVDRKSVKTQLDRERLAVQKAHLGIAARQAELSYQEGSIKLEDLKRVQSLKKSYEAATNPEEKDRIADQIDVITGKGGRFKPVMGKDDNGNPVYQGAFDERRGDFKSSSGSANASDPLGLGQLLPSMKGGTIAKERQPAPQKAQGPSSAMEAQVNFDYDAKAMSPDQLVQTYEPFASQLKPEQLRKLDEIKKSVPKRVPFMGR